MLKLKAGSNTRSDTNTLTRDPERPCSTEAVETDHGWRAVDS